MDRQRVKKLTAELQKVLDQFAKDNGLESATFKSTTFNDTEFSTKVTVKDKLSESEADDDFNNKAVMMGLPEGLRGKSFESNGKTFTITDINTRARKYPLEGVDTAGNTYKFPREVVSKLRVQSK